MSNADLIANLRGENLDCHCAAWSRGECSCTTNWPESYCRSAADALELADKRIAELEAREKILVSANSLANIERNEAERKLAVARESLKKISMFQCGTPVLTYQGMEIMAREALAQIGGEDES